jgi:hypothetical protein
LQEIKNYVFGAASGDITLISNIVKIGHVLKLQRIYLETEHGDLINILFRCSLQSKKKKKAPHVDAYLSVYDPVSMPKPLDRFFKL